MLFAAKIQNIEQITKNSFAGNKNNGCICSCYGLKMAITVLFATVIVCVRVVAAGWSRCPIMDSCRIIKMLILRTLMFWHGF